MNPFASHTTVTLPMQGDDGQTIVIRRLTGRQVEEAQASHRTDFILGRARSWSSLFRRGMKEGATDPLVLKAVADPLTGFDRYAVIRAGLVAWSYPQSLTKPVAALKGKADPTISASPETPWLDPLDDLDDDAADYIALEILRLTKPALFLTSEGDVAAAQGELSGAAPAA